MRSVLAFGDSLTWGSCPDGGGRHAFADRWPNVLAKLTGLEVISDGLRGRTTAFDMPVSPAEMSGAMMLPTVLHTHAPVDLVILMLGTNDSYCGVEPEMAARGMARLIEIVRHHPYRTPCKVPQILVVAPPVIVPSEGVTQTMIDASHTYRELVEQVAQASDVAFFDSNLVASSSNSDGFHLNAENTRAIGKALTPLVVQLMA
ncbi:lysophospholipase L1-like esterase [Litoreibacter meonggei]|uniref:Lysophospholipase L1-like esterase n=1 Tax=Litoreibacter meonggei TaxID=1049199 RepID=A0A497X537_9RHOB|nr:SGNH/GDSL hydrolase family protein [Litoreibacter meonggei]RLJ60377.1 lysophospholipase L1-like esterase [Litoreibacter meonggei]